ncbi:Smr/MutS family protein [Hyphococcus sp.]|uniref:Smr/MutS family protein n=1 Tax=Hyphococcus sp. TaxID=2038636 RepID=UPI0037526509
MRDVAPFRKKRSFSERLVSPPQPSIATSASTKSPPGLLPQRHQAPVQESRALTRRSEHPFGAGDPRLERLAGRGRLPVDAVLDLHGHTQRTAHSALLRFVADAHAHGARCVLVITGKGAPSLSEHASGQTHSGVGRGVLRARFAEWLEDAALRRYISRASPAHQRHGGAGAFYIFLKR